MRILYVTQVPLDGFNAAAQHVIGITDGLAAIGHDVDLIAPRRSADPRHDDPLRSGASTLDGSGSSGAEDGRAKPEGAGRKRQVHGYARRGDARSGRYRPGPWLEACQGLVVARQVTRERPDAAYVRVFPSTSIVPRVLEVAGIPTVLELDGQILDHLADHGPRPIAQGVVRRLLARVLRRGRPLIVPLECFGAAARQRLGAVDVEVVENGCDLETAVPGSRTRARRALGLPLDGPCVAFTGTLAPEQRLDLLEAAAAIPGVRLLIAGEGPGARQVAALADAAPHHSVRFFGAVTQQRSVEIARAADVCLDLRPGHVGSKCLDYASLGRRIVAFEAPGIERLRALYPGHEVVFALRDGSREELSAAVDAAIAAESAEPLPASAIEAARRGLGWDTTARRVSALLERMAAPRRQVSRRGGRSRPASGPWVTRRS